MDEKSLGRVYEADVMALPPLRMVLGSVPAPDPDRGRGAAPEAARPSRLAARYPAEMAVTVRRLIDYLEKKQ
jgi:hypothetical protein